MKTMSVSDITDRIRSRARELGFDRVGIASASEVSQADRYRAWLQQNFHGEMDYMAREPERRVDLDRILPGARSLICVLKNYYQGPRPAGDAMTGVVSRYAQGTDYHNVMIERLHRLREFIELEAGGKAKVCVDTAAVLERYWAAQAGLGWQGKHSLLIRRDMGSWFFLGEVVTDLELDGDAPQVKNHCGTCTRCIDLCPTKAIVAPYVVDSRKCIAYLTIEHRGPIPRELRPLMGSLIFGCDICQDVCPWNRFAQVTDEAAFMPQGDSMVPYLAELASLTEEQFRERFRHSPIKRAKRSGFLRNVAIALGNSHDERAITPLIKLLNDSEPLVRAHAAWGLGQIQMPASRTALLARQAVEPVLSVSEEIRDAIVLNRIGPCVTIPSAEVS